MSRAMPKAILILVGFVAIGLGVLHLRQQSLELRYRTAQRHREVLKGQSTLWRQQVEIAEYTSPKVIANLAGQREGDAAKSALSEKDVTGARE